MTFHNLAPAAPEHLPALVKARTRLLLFILPFAAGLATAAPAQQRDVQLYSATDVEGRLMAFYSAALAFSPIGQFAAPAPGSVSAAIELSYVPSLTAAQRSAGYDKPEATNLAPVYPRPRLRIGLPARIGLEASWLPPARVFGVTANLGALALTTPITRVHAWQVAGRAAGMIGRVIGPITCNADIAAAGSSDLRTYYRTVCRGRDSRDYFEPRHVSLEILASREGAIQAYAGAGARLDAGTRFDIGVAKPDGSYRDPDHPVLELRSVRPQLVLGAIWQARARGALAGELFYAPGSLLTARVLASARLR